ncbi:MAG: hypothetical protein V3R86_06415 [Candidatus Hydrothermarchaeaceae archaeon]
MRQQDLILASVLLIISVIVLAVKLLVSRPIQIILEEGQAIPIEGVSFFTFTDVLILIISAWAGGMAVVYILLKTEAEQKPQKEVKITEEKRHLKKVALSLLEGDENKLYQKIIDSGDEILQRDIVLESEFDRAKVTRILNKLEHKGLITKLKHGMTNKIVLKKEI